MKEYEIRPKKLLDRYIELSVKDAQKYFTDTKRLDIPCVACGGEETKPEFEKSGFVYSFCQDCETLYQSPRPDISLFESFYRDSESSNYWAEHFYPAVAEVRREKIFRPRVKRLSSHCIEQGITVAKLIDVGAGYGVFLDEWRAHHPETHAIAIEPSFSLANECRKKGFEVEENIVENVTKYKNYADLVTCFEVLEHVYDPLSFINNLKQLVKPGGYVFISTLCIDGFDLQVLWDKSSQISPPHHINFLSVNGFEKLFEKAGLENITISTPGQLDVEIVRNASISDPNLLKTQRFLQNIVNSDQKSSTFQEFLSENKMSSHIWVMGQKPN